LDSKRVSQDYSKHCCNDAEQAVAFIKKAFGATEIYGLTLSNRKITHCELIPGDSVLNIGESMDGWPAHVSPDDRLTGHFGWNFGENRFARPVCYKDCPQSALSPEWQDHNPLGVWRLVHGEFANRNTC
jgi:hypothetical protein